MKHISKCLNWQKHLLTLVLMLMFAGITAYADEQRKIKLDGDHNKETVRLPFCNIFVEMTDQEDEDNARVMVEIENLDESNVIILFGHAYPEKELKRLSPSIRYDKNFPGSKGRRNIDTYREARSVIFIDPSEKKRLPEIMAENEKEQLCRLPLYIAKYKEKGFLSSSKLLLMEKQIIELEIEVELKPDEDFVRIDSTTTDLIDRIGKQVFCTNSKHRPSLERQERPYKNQIQNLEKEIDEVIARHHWKEDDKGYQRYADIKKKLSAIDFSRYERDCGRRHTTRVATGCKYCGLSAQQIYHKLDDYYKMIYNSKDRKAAKENVIAEVELLYSCSSHASKWRNSNYQALINDRYKRISNF